MCVLLFFASKKHIKNQLLCVSAVLLIISRLAPPAGKYLAEGQPSSSELLSLLLLLSGPCRITWNMPHYHPLQITLSQDQSLISPNYLHVRLSPLPPLLLLTPLPGKKLWHQQATPEYAYFGVASRCHTFFPIV